MSLINFLHPKFSDYFLRELRSDDAHIVIAPIAVLENTRLFRSALPDVGMYYAYKCFPEAKIINSIDKELEGYDVASQQEIKELIDLGVDASRMIFSNPVKIPGHIEYAYKNGVKKYVFQSLDELKKISKLAPNTEVILRIKIDDKSNSSGQIFSRKFGADPTLATNLLLEAKSLGLDPIGLTFHVGSQTETISLWHNAIKLCGQIMQEAKYSGISVSLLDIGGGFPVNYLSNDFNLFQDIASTIRIALRKFVDSEVNIIAEPGRFLVADSGCLIVNIIGRETRDDKEWLFLDVGVFNGLFEVFEFSRLLQSVEVLSNNSTSEKINFTLAGPTCDGDDVISENIPLPNDIVAGDKLIFSKAGAYISSYCTNFNGFLQPKLFYLD